MIVPEKLDEFGWLDELRIGMCPTGDLPQDVFCQKDGEGVC